MGELDNIRVHLFKQSSSTLRVERFEGLLQDSTSVSVGGEVADMSDECLMDKIGTGVQGE